MKWETVIGLEIHAQLLTRTKLFCACPTTFGEAPNTKTCPVCLGLPGSLPVLNEYAIELATRAALAFHCKINSKSVFARKNYFYPDLPKGYQISQYDRPLAGEGWIEIESNSKTKKIGITRIHLEEDAGKLIHEESDEFSLVDFNRSCIPLIEIVSEPDITSPLEASEYLKMLRLVLIYNKICDGNMELGNLRCDANISVKKIGEKSLGTKTELKNMNSFNFIEKALEYEEKRQIHILEKGGKIVQETLLWDSQTNKTVSMRTKEEAHDYRYFDEPDLLPLKVSEKFIEKVKNNFSLTHPETLINKSKEYMEKGIPKTQVETIINSPRIYSVFNESLKYYDNSPARSASLAISVLTNSTEDNPNDPTYLANSVKATDAGKISFTMAKEIFTKSRKINKDPIKIIEEGFTQISDESEIDTIIDLVLKNSQKQVDEYKSGKEQLLNFFLGQVMKESKGKINPKLATERLKEKLKR